VGARQLTATVRPRLDGRFGASPALRPYILYLDLSYLDGVNDKAHNAIRACQIKNKVDSQRKVRAKLLQADEVKDAQAAVSQHAKNKAADAAAQKVFATESKNDDAAPNMGSAATIKEAVAMKHGGKKTASMSDDYEATVQKAMVAGLVRRSAERTARSAFRLERAKKLAADSSDTGETFPSCVYDPALQNYCTREISPRALLQDLINLHYPVLTLQRALHIPKRDLYSLKPAQHTIKSDLHSKTTS